MKKITTIVLLILLTVFSGCSQYERGLLEEDVEEEQTEELEQESIEVVARYDVEMELDGWMLYSCPSHINRLERCFYVANESLQNLPPFVYEKIQEDDELRNFTLNNATESDIEELLNMYSGGVPGTIQVSGLSLMSAGAPSLEFIEIVAKEGPWTIEVNDDLGTQYVREVNLKGWIIYRSGYVGPPEEPHFRIAEESYEELPSHVSSRLEVKPHLGDYRLRNATDSDIERLLQYSEGNPATIKINRLTVLSEGTPLLDFVEIVY